jgi:chromosome segregation ATPase
LHPAVNRPTSEQLLEEKATLEQSIERLNAKVKGLATDKEKCKREVQEKERRIKFVNSDMQRLRVESASNYDELQSKLLKTRKEAEAAQLRCTEL